MSCGIVRDIGILERMGKGMNAQCSRGKSRRTGSYIVLYRVVNSVGKSHAGTRHTRSKTGIALRNGQAGATVKEGGSMQLCMCGGRVQLQSSQLQQYGSGSFASFLLLLFCERVGSSVVYAIDASIQIRLGWTKEDLSDGIVWSECCSCFSL
jgi:hypothetical protein